MTEPLARRERHALCDLALEVGPDAPTRCEGWDVRDLVCHLLVRERSPWGAAGLVVPPLSGLTDRAMAARAEEPFDDLVRRLRSPGLSPYALPVVERAANTAEYFVHHEDVRRAQPGWEPRDLPEQDEATLWKQLRLAGRALARHVGVGVVTVHAGTGERATLRRGTQPVVLTGRPSELLLLLFGRPSADVVTDGPPESVRRFAESRKGL